MNLWCGNSKVQSILVVTLAISLVGFLDGCSKLNMHPKMGQNQVREQATNATAQQAIHVIGEVSENVYDEVKAKDWQKASTQLNTLKQANAELKSTKAERGSAQYVDRISNDLSKHIDKQDRLPAMESANELTRVAMDLGQPVEATLPKELSLLDYYGRELEIGAISKDKGKMSGTAKSIKQTWRSLKPKVGAQAKAKKVTGEEARFEQLVKQLDTAKTSEEYQHLATQILDHVDKLENIFSKTG